MAVFARVWRPSGSSAERSVVGCGNAHLVGALGSGMRSLADVLLGQGWRVTGSDRGAADEPVCARPGFVVRRGHAADNVPADSDLVVHSDAIPPENPELRRAVDLGIPTLSYFQMLGRLMADRRGIAIAGTHGKSTTSAMLAEILVHAGLDPTVCYGAAPLGQPSSGRPGRGHWMVAEACEYRANFLHLRPEHAAILNVEPDHFDCYRSWAELRAAFARFARSAPPHGTLVVNARSTAAIGAAAGVASRVETFGLSPDADWQARSHTSRRGLHAFEIVRRGRAVCEVSLRVPGRHNVENALAAAALAWAAGVGPEGIAAGLAQFRGIQRRLERLGTWGGVTLVDDYAHHPTEVAASLRTVRQMWPSRRTWCVFQPHQASRTARLLDELAVSLQNADVVLVADIYRAREPAPRPDEVTAAQLARRARDQGAAVPSWHAADEIVRHLESSLRPGDVLVTMGAGDIRKIADELVERFREDRAAV